jgi:probable rRNA maturation factor
VKLVVLLDGDETLSRLNKEFRHQDKPTNVLSFPSSEAILDNLRDIQNSSAVFLGDIAISYERVYEESIEQTKEFLDHFTHILVHATLHLVGYDHVNEEDAKRMERIEIVVLHNLGFQNPYVLEHVTDAFIMKL